MQTSRRCYTRSRSQCPNTPTTNEPLGKQRNRSFVTSFSKVVIKIGKSLSRCWRSMFRQQRTVPSNAQSKHNPFALFTFANQLKSPSVALYLIKSTFMCRFLFFNCVPLTVGMERGCSQG